MEAVQRLHPVRVVERRVLRGLASPGVREVDRDDSAALVAGRREVLLGADQDVAALHARRPDRAVGRPAGVVHEVGVLRHAVVAVVGAHGRRVPLEAAAGDQDRLERRRPAHAVLVRVAMPALGGIAADAAAAGDPGDAALVLVDVVRVVGELSLRQRSTGRSETSGSDGSRRSVTQIGRPSPTARGPEGRRRRAGVVPSQFWSSRRAGPPVQMYLQSWMQLDVWPDGRLTKSPIWRMLPGSAYEMT